VAPKTLPKVLSREDAEKILKSINLDNKTGYRNRAMLQVMYCAGLRVSEVANLAPADVDLKKGFIYVQLGKGKKDRYIPLDPKTVEMLGKWMKLRPEQSPWLFPTLKGTRLDVRYIREMVYRLSDKAGVYLQNGRDRVRVHPHTFRHCFATECLEEKFSVKEVQELLGHSSIQTTSRYLSVRPAVLAEKMQGRSGV
jgi:integrase/recombinase XerD